MKGPATPPGNPAADFLSKGRQLMQHDSSIRRDRRQPRPEISSVSVCDGRRALGTVKVDHDRYTAITDTGRVIGVYGDLKKAVKAFGEGDQ
jgi:hypothetical protein